MCYNETIYENQFLNFLYFYKEKKYKLSVKLNHKNLNNLFLVLKDTSNENISIVLKLICIHPYMSFLMLR